ncbi:hypothetical protein CKM354_000167900 [Cercospora kikuchii]|uniref:Uncharacterized protein n=1 Tax=Cercospora kikuchii TaxID=84275 RepID=A0A9P3C8I3_9PEZI|nr:uncharacterized protein CKM354_000167900 [Cercospora kikuchii]GIZ38258.1 hypothetical protein CKM354_000167900 [Cercospora kikuchii]
MSVTTTDNARITTLRHTLADYELHHSQPTAEQATQAPAPNSRDEQQQSLDNPAGWEDRWRRVPAYQPVNPELIHGGGRNQVQNEIERNFIRVMFSGVWLQSAGSHLWRSTCGKLRDDIFRVKVGGEW